MRPSPLCPCFIHCAALGPQCVLPNLVTVRSRLGPVGSSPVTFVSAMPAAGFRLAQDPDVRILVANVGLACCSMEVDSAIQAGLLVAEDAGSTVADRTILLVSGTVTDALAPAVVRMHAELPAPVLVVAFGACASTGGPYWDAPTVTKGIDQLLDVITYIPGCPPRPDALAAALLHMVRGVPS